mmetsp:Transcript_4322/g.4091  ORF Transcript_4322/g.4091 Transcript_4322/m.4091 type:complete len:81 (+) Transcript_4322:2878-3120(+)
MSAVVKLIPLIGEVVLLVAVMVLGLHQQVHRLPLLHQLLILLLHEVLIYLQILVFNIFLILFVFFFLFRCILVIFLALCH